MTGTQHHSQEPPLIGGNIRRIRKEAGLTMDVLAERSGVSKAMLSQIEAEKVNPTVATVWKISQGLQVEINRLLEGSEEPVRKFHVTTRDDIIALDTDEEGLHIDVLTPIQMVEDLEMYLLSFAPGGALRSAPHFPNTEEFLTVIRGSIHVRAGDRDARLGEGDFIRYQCDVEHDIENTSEESSLVHMVVRFHKRSLGH
ncbi:transcriptional regulator, XRE family with cupin sensor [Alkalispirochaeta americana]|uniref:Transcriptional regulator, XRE family with cupin sensor n=1 Tax=Alkalispirochaeta americana TaxID=159291 RepID=A0A1N6WYW2_9SPIO|nr:XRE family transcriptional regulator [Alkalispirochaeta americana]SIQ95257.1 transcriptional regulator, XRE family with cupin sensor [Alkalispirochaeta americana]